jgi:hypothetical protein
MYFCTSSLHRMITPVRLGAEICLVLWYTPAKVHVRNPLQMCCTARLCVMSSDSNLVNAGGFLVFARSQQETVACELQGRPQKIYWNVYAILGCETKIPKTPNRRDSQMVTHSSTSRPVQCLCMAERTGCPVLTDLRSYIQVDRKHSLCTQNDGFVGRLSDGS